MPPQVPIVGGANDACGDNGIYRGPAQELEYRPDASGRLLRRARRRRRARRDNVGGDETRHGEHGLSENGECFVAANGSTAARAGKVKVVGWWRANGLSP